MPITRNTRAHLWHGWELLLDLLHLIAAAANQFFRLDNLLLRCISGQQLDHPEGLARVIRLITRIRDFARARDEDVRKEGTVVLYPLGERDIDGDAAGVLGVIKMPIGLVEDERRAHGRMGEGRQRYLLVDKDDDIQWRISGPEGERFLGGVEVGRGIFDEWVGAILESGWRRRIGLCALLAWDEIFWTELADGCSNGISSAH